MNQSFTIRIPTFLIISISDLKNKQAGGGRWRAVDGGGRWRAVDGGGRWTVEGGGRWRAVDGGRWRAVDGVGRRRKLNCHVVSDGGLKQLYLTNYRLFV